MEKSHEKTNQVVEFQGVGNALPAGTVLNFRTYIAVGSTANVKTTLSQLYQKWQAGTL